MSGLTFVVYSEEPEVGEALRSLVERNTNAEIVAIASDESLLRTVIEKERPQFLRI